MAFPITVVTDGVNESQQYDYFWMKGPNRAILFGTERPASIAAGFGIRESGGQVQIKNSGGGWGSVGGGVGFTTVTIEATAGAVTYTAAQLLGGLILRDPAGGNRSDVTPTAALLIAALPGAAAGTSFEFTIRNTADAAETITITAGDSVTLSGTMTIAQNNTKRFRLVVTSATAATLYSIGTFVH